jgi:hypothetical protein
LLLVTGTGTVPPARYLGRYDKKNNNTAIVL